jgi:predicted polyphosphate/ATP-dependent NAD kinase
MGEDEARAAGFAPVVVGSPASGATSADDTRTAAVSIADSGVDLLLFAGGDGTARDIHAAIGGRLPVLGIPAGVKIHSAAFGVTPRAAGELAALFVTGGAMALRDAEVMDIDEDAFRMGRVSAALYGYLRVPADAARTQSMKAGRVESDASAQEQLVYRIVDEMVPDDLYVIGPGTTTHAITNHLGLAGTLLGVDVVRNEELVAADVTETRLLEILAGQPPGSAWIVVTIIGGQGYLFGRGNQQISPRVIAHVGRSRIRVLATPLKVGTLGGGPLLVDTGDPALDAAFAGHIRVAVGYNQDLVMRVASEG